MPRTDFLLVTALDEERDAILRHISMSPCPARHDDVRYYYQGRVSTQQHEYTLALVSLLRMGHIEAANATSDAIRQWNPRYVVLVGIAGGIAAKGAGLGDILVSDQIVDYELQKKRDSGDEFRWISHQVDPRLLGAAKNLPAKAWKNAVAEPRPSEGLPACHFGPIATGNKVIASEVYLKQLRSHYPALIGVEMEAGGVAAATFQAAVQPGFFMVRAVSDLADPAKDSQHVKSWRSYACDAAAAYVAALIGASPVPLAQLDSPPTNNEPNQPSPTRGQRRKPDTDPHSVPVFRLRADGLEGGDDAALEHVITALEIAKQSNHDCFCLVLPEADENEEKIAQLKSIPNRNEAERSELVARIGNRKRNDEIQAKLRKAFRLVLQDPTFRKSAGLGDLNPEYTWEILVHLRRQLFRQIPVADRKVVYVSTTATERIYGDVLLTRAEFESENTRYLADDLGVAYPRRQGMFAGERYVLDAFTPSTVRRTCLATIALLLADADDARMPLAVRDAKTWRLSIDQPTAPAAKSTS